MIVFDNVSYQYEEKIEALQGITLTIKDGEHVALIGPIGCGKTTLIRHLNALLLPMQGTVTVDGMDTHDEKNHRELRRAVGMVFQNPDYQIVGTTVEEDIAFGPENLCLPPKEIKRRVAEAMEAVGIQELAGRQIENLSGGEKRLAALAGVIAMSPRYIALDEPTAFLDPASAERILIILGRLHARGMGIIHITHDMEEAARTNRIIVMNNGCVHQEGAARDVFKDAQSLKAMGLQLPAATDLLIVLHEMGLPVRTDIVDREEAVKEVKKLLEEKAKKKVQGLLDL